MTVGLFVPCLAEHFDARPVEATTLLLRHLGLEVDYPRAQTCCGQPFRTNGDLASAEALGRRMASVFARHDRVVTLSSSCAAMVTRHAPTLRPGDPAIVALGAKTVELAAFLLDLGFDPGTASWPGAAVYHPSCHGRDLGADPVPALLARVRDLTLIPLPWASQCCGFGGAFASRFPEVSTALGRDKLANVDATAARALIANDSGCRLHLRSLAPRLPVVHLAEVLAEGLGLMPRRPHRAGGP